MKSQHIIAFLVSIFSQSVVSLLTQLPQGSLQGMIFNRSHQLRRGTLSSDCTIESYTHKGSWKLTYIFKPASLGFENHSPLLLVHPVGIGLSSWFWIKFIEEFNAGPALYAVDLIGCGLEHGADAWNPNERGMFFPLSWTEGCETLLNNIIIPRFAEQLKTSFQSNCIVITQGGVAPVGIMLAYRNPQTVSKLIMASPPKWTDLIHPIPQAVLKRNYYSLSLPIIGPFLFKLLETRFAIRLFSNLFLFSKSCDERWLDMIIDSGSISVAAREPIKAFNAGLLNNRSYKNELRSLIQPTLVLSGSKDKRQTERIQFNKEMANCSLKMIDGLNVLPWENVTEFKRIVSEFA